MANTKTNKPSATIGVDMYTFFPVTAEDATALTYGEAVSLPGTVQISPTDKGGNYTFDADNGAYDTVSYIETPGHEITNADIPPAVDAMWRGIERDGSGMVTVGDTKAPYFGVAWRTKKMDDTYRYVRYFKGKYSFASNVGGQTKPSSGAPDAQTAQATYTAVKSPSGGYYTYFDESDLPEGVTPEELCTGWFSSMDYVPAAAVAAMAANLTETEPVATKSKTASTTSTAKSSS